MKTLQIEDLKCEVHGSGQNGVVTYLVYPEIEGVSEAFISRMIKSYGIDLVVVYVPAGEWNNYLTPWPEPPESSGFDPFGGKASRFLEILKNEIIPAAEKALGVEGVPRRDMVGVSLSGLFNLWQWMLGDTFRSIACLSGSFWYEGFMEWFDARPVPEKSGKAFFLLGEEEPKAKIRAYRSVGENTQKIVARLKEAGIDTEFEWVPGNHFSDPVGRLEKAFAGLYE